jgi:hypothetical protein
MNGAGNLSQYSSRCLVQRTSRLGQPNIACDHLLPAKKVEINFELAYILPKLAYALARWSPAEVPNELGRIIILLISLYVLFGLCRMGYRSMLHHRRWVDFLLLSMT